MRVFKVFDDEWEEIMGERQVIEFAQDQILNNFEDLNDPDLEYYIEVYKPELKEDLKDILKKVFDKREITLEEALKILPIRIFDFEELNIY